MELFYKHNSIVKVWKPFIQQPSDEFEKLIADWSRRLLRVMKMLLLEFQQNWVLARLSYKKLKKKFLFLSSNETYYRQRESDFLFLNIVP